MENRLLSTDRPVAIYYAFPDEITSYKKTDASHCTIKLSGDGWKLINTTVGSIDFNEDPQDKKGGVLHVSKLNAICPGHDENTPGDISQISGRRVLLRLDYRNGMKKIVGSDLIAPKLFIGISSNTTTKRKLQSKFDSPSPNLWLS